jgi:hypothetical protein
MTSPAMKMRTTTVRIFRFRVFATHTIIPVIESSWRILSRPAARNATDDFSYRSGS